MIPKGKLQELYLKDKKSMQEIAGRLDCSVNKVKYWMEKYDILRRSIGEGIYVKNNPNGDPFKIKKIKSQNDFFMFGLGLGLYWGEGTKSNKHSVRLGNTDSKLIIKFIEFLDICFIIRKDKLKFGLQIFSDLSPEYCLSYWAKKLSVSKKQFQKVIITPARGVGTYRNKLKYGVLTVHFNNKKLRDHICNEISKL